MERSEPASDFQNKEKDREQHTIVLEPVPAAGEKVYHETALPFAGSTYRPQKEVLPERLRQMRRLYEYGRESMESKARNFLRQGKFMEDYEDDAPWEGDFVCFFPTYHDLTTKQLRGYFSWRTRVRRGEYLPIPKSAAYIYIYELLNGIGTVSPEDSLQKMQAFEEGFLDAGYGDARMRKNLRRWMTEFAVVENLPASLAETYADPEEVLFDASLAALQNPDSCSDDDVFSGLCAFVRSSLEHSPAVTGDPARGRHLVAEAWRRAVFDFRGREEDLFTLCFGKRKTRLFQPLSNAVCSLQTRTGDRDYILNPCRSYHCRGGIWEMSAYEKLRFDTYRLHGFVRETDRILRRYLKAGRNLPERKEDAWAAPYIRAVIEEERRAILEASRPKITIDLSDLPRIREDSLKTQDSLLAGIPDEAGILPGRQDGAPGADQPAPGSVGEYVPDRQDEQLREEDPDRAGWACAADAPAAESPAVEQGSEGRTAGGLNMEEKAERTVTAGNRVEEGMSGGELPADNFPAGSPPDLPLSAAELQILRVLLDGGDPAGILREHFLMPSIVADTVNEALFDEIGDTALVCEDDRLSLVEDYIDDIRSMLGGVDT